ncbi:hypothetical protein IJH89_02775 [Candidatus Saccharibacteria bacterium]|nr:hypothetical protein [Candidatus Saccharibacteria bacterium]
MLKRKKLLTFLLAPAILFGSLFGFPATLKNSASALDVKTEYKIDGNHDLCLYLGLNVCDELDMSTPLALTDVSFDVPSGSKIYVKNVNVEFSGEKSGIILFSGYLEIEDSTFKSSEGCFLTLTSSKEAVSSQLLIKSGSFETSSSTLPSPICYRPLLSDVSAGTSYSPEIAYSLLKTAVSPTASYFQETESKTLEEVKETYLVIDNTVFRKGYTSKHYLLNSSKIIVEELGRGEETPTPDPETPDSKTPDDPTPESSPETETSASVVVPKAPNTGRPSALR